MAALSRILNVLVLLAAVAALVIGLKLSKHRDYAQQRGTDYAKVIQDTGGVLDQGSGTANSYAKLSWQDYEGDQSGTQAAAKKLIGQAEAVISQRDAMATSVANLGSKIDAEDIDPARLKGIDTYVAEIAKIDGRIDAVKQRDDALIAQIVAMSAAVDKPVTAEDLANVETAAATAQAVTDDVKSTKQYLTAHTKNLEKIVAAVAGPETTFTPEELKKADLVKTDSLLRDLDSLAADRTALNNLKVAMESKEADLKKVEAELASANETIVNLEKRIGEGPVELDVPKPPSSFVTRGEVLTVNYDLNYVIIDLGTGNSKIAEGTVLAISRNKEFICNVTVTKVYENNAVADVSDQKELMPGVVIPGDTVFLLEDL